MNSCVETKKLRQFSAVLWLPDLNGWEARINIKC